MKKNLSEMIRESIKQRCLFLNIFLYILYKMNFCNTQIVRNIRYYKIYTKLRKKYVRYIKTEKKLEKKQIVEKNKNIWIFWYQGMENAPDIVRACYNSIKEHLNTWNIILITKENYMEYVNIPEYIIEKLKKNVMTITHFSDILRLALLEKYGGLWLDATVYCSGNIEIEKLIKNDLFVYRNGWWDNEETINIESWLIYSDAHNKIIKDTLKMLYSYWEKENYLCNYFLMHLFFRISIEENRKEFEKMPYFNQIDNHLLQADLLKKIDYERVEKIKELTDFHKLTYKLNINTKQDDSLYDYIIKEQK